MSLRFKVGDLVVRNPEVRDEAGWPYDDAVCRVVGYDPSLNEIVVVPVNRPPNTRRHNISWLPERFTHADDAVAMLDAMKQKIRTLEQACEFYDAALKASCPEGAKGEARRSTTGTRRVI